MDMIRPGVYVSGIYNPHCFKANVNPGLLMHRRVYSLTWIKTFVIHCEGSEEAWGDNGVAQP